MTTVVIDFSKRQIVADKQTTSKYYQKRRLFNLLSGSDPKIADWSFGKTNTTTKIKKNDDGTYLVAAGDCSEISRQKRYYDNNQHIDKPKGDCTIAIVSRKGDGLFVDMYESEKKWFGYKWKKTITQGTDRVITFGSGRNYAYGAFKATNDAVKSVLAASECDIYTSPEYDLVEL